MGSLAGSNGGAQTKPPKPQGQLRRAQAGVKQGRGLQLQQAGQAHSATAESWSRAYASVW